MKILSWDIGIIHLSYCMVNFNEETKEVFIEEWEIINLLEDEINEQKICSYINQRKPYNKCKHFAKFKTYNEKEFYCKIHLKYYNHQKPFISNLCNENIQKCTEENCKNNAKYTVNDIPKCYTHKKQIELFFFRNYKLIKLKTVKCNKYSMDKLADKIITIMDSKYKHLLNCDIVLLENQPRVAKKMKIISNYLEFWFRMRGKHELGCIKEIKYYNATNKLKFNKNNIYPKNYTERKKLAIENVKEYLYLKNDTLNLNKFNNYKKQDDLSDSLLQILSYLKIKCLIF